MIAHSSPKVKKGATALLIEPVVASTGIVHRVRRASMGEDDLAASAAGPTYSATIKGFPTIEAAEAALKKLEVDDNEAPQTPLTDMSTVVSNMLFVDDNIELYEAIQDMRDTKKKLKIRLREYSAGELKEGSVLLDDDKLLAMIHGKADDTASAKNDNEVTLIVGVSGTAKIFVFTKAVIMAESSVLKETLTKRPEFNNFIREDVHPKSFQLIHKALALEEIDHPVDYFGVTFWFMAYADAASYGMEKMQNIAIDVIRAYFRTKDQTCAPFRIASLASAKVNVDKLLEFALDTTILREFKNDTMDITTKTVLEKYDLVEKYYAMVNEAMSDTTFDPRAGSDCRYHVHEWSPVCEVAQVDGAGDNTAEDKDTKTTTNGNVEHAADGAVDGI